jgi:hypothetical protein
MECDRNSSAGERVGRRGEPEGGRRDRFEQLATNGPANPVTTPIEFVAQLVAPDHTMLTPGEVEKRTIDHTPNVRADGPATEPTNKNRCLDPSTNPNF